MLLDPGCWGDRENIVRYDNSSSQGKEELETQPGKSWFDGEDQVACWAAWVRRIQPLIFLRHWVADRVARSGKTRYLGGFFGLARPRYLSGHVALCRYQGTFLSLVRDRES